MRTLLNSITSAVVVVTMLGWGAAPQVSAAAPGTEAAHQIRLHRGPMPVQRAFRLKAAMGEAAFAADLKFAVNGLWTRVETTGRCASSSETSAAAQLELVRRSHDPEAFSKSRAAAEAALARRRELRALYLGGAKTPPPYGLVGRMVARATAEPNPRLAVLYRRMAEDQFSRIDSITLRPFAGPGVHTDWEKGLDDAALAYVAATISGEWCPMDHDNAAWLMADIRAHGWYRISIYGADADRAAWVIVQHARHDLAFQGEALAMIEPLWKSGETRGENYALLYDQTAHYQGRPGRFGVNGQCTAPGVWTPDAVEDSSATDAWRAKAGMPPVAQYIATSSRGCTE
jgi:hypothetical protein